jgi:WD40 repeat protein
MSAPLAPTLALTLEFARAEKTDDPFAFRQGPQTYLVRGAGGGFTAIELGFSAEFVATLAALRQPGRDPALVQRIGEDLRRFLATSSWPAQEARLVSAVQAEQPVQLTIRSAAAELYALPWELLTIKATGQHLGELPSVLLRYEWPETQSRPIAAQHRDEPGRILFAWSAAGGAVPASDHLSAIEAACRLGHLPFSSPRDVLPNATSRRLLATLQAAKKEGPGIAVLHLLCHGTTAGTTFGLALDGEGAGDRAQVVDASRLRQLLAPFADMLRLVVLSACDSGNSGEPGNQLGSIAQTLHRAGIAAVVASRYPLSVAGSIRFTETFYRELCGAPASVEQSLLAARQALASDAEQIDWASLQLYAHVDAGADSRPLVFRPYRGLLAFAPEHRRFFFGRDREVAELLADFGTLRDRGQPRLLALDGASGTGKSSVLFAGALPQLLALLGPAATYLRMRPGSTPDKTLSEGLSEHTPGTPLLLIVDQFEELFTHVHDAHLRQSFARRLWQLATAADSGVSVILTLRSDFVGSCGDLVLDDSGLRLDRVIYDQAHRVSVAQMNREQLRAVITRPAERVGLKLEQGLPERMLHDVDSEPGALPLLADTLDLLWQRRVEDTLTQAAYDEIGGVAGALHGRADQLIASLSAGEQNQARRLLVRLGSGLSDVGQGVRLRVAVSSRRPRQEALREPFERALLRLVEARLLVLDRDGEEQTVEVAHEALLRKWPRLHQWVREDRQMLQQAETVESWTVEAERSRTLFSLDRLIYAERVAREFPELLGHSALLMVQNSRRAQDLAEERDRFARDSLRVLAAQAFKHDPTRQAMLLREAESADPTEVPGFLATAAAILHTNALTVAEHHGHTDAVVSVAMSAVGERIVSASSDRTARIWQTVGGADPIILSGHTDIVACCAFSPDGRLIATGSHDQTVRIWSPAGGAPIQILEGHQDKVWDVAFSPDGSHLASASSDRTARLWSIASPGNPIVLSGHEDELSQVTWDREGAQVATASDDGTARVFALSGRKPPIVLSGHTDRVNSVQFDHSGSRVLTASDDGTARLWNLLGRRTPQVFKLDDPIAYARMSPNGKLIALGEETGRISVCDPAGRSERVVSFEQDYELTGMEWISDSQLVATFDDGLVMLLQATQAAPPLYLRGHRNRVTCAAFNPARRLIVTSSIDCTVRTWAPERAEPQPAALLKEEEAGGFTFAHDLAAPLAIELQSPDRKLRARVSADGSVHIEPSQTAGAAVLLPPAGGTIQLLAFSPDGSRLATVTEDHCARIYRSSGGDPVVLRGHTDAIRCICFSPDGERVVTGSDDWAARVWHCDGSVAPTVLSGHTQAVTLAVFTPDGGKLLTVDESGALMVWNGGGRGETLFSDSSIEVIAVATDCTHFVCRGDEEVNWVFALELDPPAIMRRLQQATPLCLSTAERERYLREPHDLALRNHQTSLNNIRR